MTIKRSQEHTTGTMEEAIRDVFPDGVAQKIFLLTLKSRREELHKEFMTKINKGDRFLYRAWRLGGVFVKNGCLAYQIARNNFNASNHMNFVKAEDGLFYRHEDDRADCELVSDGHISMNQWELARDTFNNKTFKFLYPIGERPVFRCENYGGLVRPSFTRKFIIDYLTNNGFKKIKSKTKKELIRLTQSF